MERNSTIWSTKEKLRQDFSSSPASRGVNTFSPGYERNWSVETGRLTVVAGVKGRATTVSLFNKGGRVGCSFSSGEGEDLDGAGQVSLVGVKVGAEPNYPNKDQEQAHPGCPGRWRVSQRWRSNQPTEGWSTPRETNEQAQ